jgi:regulator of protease activity HflC (stomatin/prohibitin superfamily)
MDNIIEKKNWRMNGFLVLFLFFILSGLYVGCLIFGIQNDLPAYPVIGSIVYTIIVILVCGLYVVQPNDARVFILFGKYYGTTKEAGFYWTNPFCTRKKVSLRMLNFNSEKLKVNDALGNPIEIAAVVVWQVVDSAKAVFDVENYINFVGIQSETAIRTLATHYPYDTNGQSSAVNTETLRGNQEFISGELTKRVQERLGIAGVKIIEARISHLAYAPEIAQVMLRRQQAEAVISARKLIVEGAVSIVEMALSNIEKQANIKLDDEKKAAMINNLLVALVSENQTQPIINTGTLYS